MKEVQALLQKRKQLIESITKQQNELIEAEHTILWLLAPEGSVWKLSYRPAYKCVVIHIFDDQIMMRPINKKHYITVPFEDFLNDWIPAREHDRKAKDNN